MNILFFTSTIPDSHIGGVEAVTRKLMQIFERSGHQVYGISKFPVQDSTCSVEKFVTFPEHSEWVASEKNITFAKSFCEEKDIDIIINNAVHHEFVLLGNVLRSEKIKVISCWHSASAILMANIKDRFSGILYNKGLTRCIQLLKFLMTLPVNLTSSRAWMQKKFYEMYKYSDACVLLSSAFIDEFVKIGRISNSERIYAIPNPMELNTNINTDNRKKAVLWLGRMEFEAKRPDRMLKIWRQVQANNPDWELWMCGDGPAKASLETYCIKRKIKNVKFCGKVNSSEIYPHVSIFCMTSSYEGFPMVIVESLSKHIPIIAFSSFATLFELCVNHKNSIFIPPFSIKRYAKELDTLMRDSEKRQKLSSFDNSYLNKFSWETIGKQWENLFKKLKGEK